MPRVQFVSQSERDDDNIQSNTSRLINLFPQVLGEGGKSPSVLKSVLGMAPHVTLPELFVRDMAEVGGDLYALCGGTLYRVTSTGEFSNLATAPLAEDARLFGAELGKICIVSDGRYFVWDGSTLTEPTGGNFSTFGSGAFFKQYVLLSRKNGREFLWSDLGDATTLPGLNFASAEATDGAILRIIPFQGFVWIMKEDVIEVWGNTGQAGANAFTALSGGVIETGLKSADLATRMTGGVFFVGNDDIVYISGGQGAQPVSTPAVSTAIDQSTPTRCIYWEDEGHKFCAILFSDRPAWVYDIATGKWLERASFEQDPWRIECGVKAYGSWFVGQNTGKISRLTRNNADEADPLIRTAISSTIYMDGRRFRISHIGLTGRMGVGVDGAQGEVLTLYFEDGREYEVLRDDFTMEDSAVLRLTHEPVREPTIRVSMSRDGGRTWGRERVKDLGAIGEYGQRVRLRSLGSFPEQAAMRVVMSDPQEITMDASANVDIA